MRRFLKKLVAESLRRIIYPSDVRALPHSAYLRESTEYADIGEPGPLIEDLFNHIKEIPGWFNVDDCGHFFLVLSCQSAMGFKGDLLEIGSYHGRSTAVMAKCLQPDERIVVCDAFQSDTEDGYADKPSPENLVSNIRSVNRDIASDLIVIHNCLSNDLQLAPGERFRFIHIDGGHSAEQVLFDLKLCSEHLLPNGIIVVDDYHNKAWPGVTQGTDRFLAASDDLAVFADLNRHGALGRKLYLIKK